MASMDNAMLDVMITSVKTNAPEPQLEEEGASQSYSYFTGTCGRVCTALTHFSCCLAG
ncbi:hypothetical protein [Sorangium cellulosum]|uniref:hypothetical protein n=1 Tax=Sorangium TaxID=39643 RepID=UPI000A71DD0E|nr:hypothetical protein [Sorangium cellulosum]